MRPLSSSPNKSNTWTMCSLPMCRGLWARCAQVCTSVFRVCTVCARVSVSVVHGVHGVQECRWPWRRFSASVLRSVRTFAECVGLCRRTRRASESVWRLGRVVRGSGKTAPERISAWGAKASPGAESGSFSVRREKWRLFRGRPGPSGGGFGDLAKSGAPAAILINAYSGDFCHPVLSNALAQEPLVYHSGTRELFSDIFGNTSKTDGTESDIFVFFEIFEIFAKNVKKWNFWVSCSQNVNSCSRMFVKYFHNSAHVEKVSAQICTCRKTCRAQIWQMCKCAKMCRAQNAQICSANIFPNAEITNLQMHNFVKCRISSVHNFWNAKLIFHMYT